MTFRAPTEERTPPPFERLRGRLASLAGAFEQRGHAESAAELRHELDAWWPEQLVWNDSVRLILEVHHEINNALVGVRGNAQLAVLGPAGQVPGLRERMDVITRESQRIQDLAARLRHLRAALGDTDASARAA